MNVQELEGTLGDYIAAARQAFAAAFPVLDDDGKPSDDLYVRDVFERAVIVHDEEHGQMYRVDMTANPDGTFVFAPRSAWQPVKLTYTAEMVGDTVVTEFAGRPPDVPLREGVDVAELTAGDDNPFFLTVEISQVGRVSRNGLLHDDELANTLVSQINAQAAEGIMGHIKETERATAYPVSDVHWLGAVRQGRAVWAKGYIPRTAIAQREHFRILKATNGRAATSITGPAVREFVDKREGTWRAKNFRLEQLDLAPYTRAALPPDSGFVITRELAYAPAAPQEEAEMSREQILAELTVTDIPVAVREQIVRDATAGRDAKIELLETAVAEFRRREVERSLDAQISELANWPVTSPEAQAKLAALRGLVRRQVVAELGDEVTGERLTETVQRVWGELQPLAEAVRDALSGPAAVVSSRGRTTRTLDTSPEAVERARGNWGI